MAMRGWALGYDLFVLSGEVRDYVTYGRKQHSNIFKKGRIADLLTKRCLTCSQRKALYRFAFSGRNPSVPGVIPGVISDWCADCFAESHICHYCYNEVIEDLVEIGDRPRCNNCAERLGLGIILNYRANPLTVLKFDKKLSRDKFYHGVELEVEVAKGELPSKAAKELKESLDNKCIIKRDGSLANGFELCTLPMGISEHEDFWSKTFENKIWDHLQADNASTTGLHIHTSRAPFNANSIARMRAVVNQLSNRRFMHTIAGREGNRYCKYLNITPASAMGQGDNNKYSALNILHQDSLELRIFKATKDKNLLLTRLEFARALSRFSRSTNELEKTTVKDFTTWLGDQKRFDRLKKFVHDLPPKVFEYLNQDYTFAEKINLLVTQYGIKRGELIEKLRHIQRTNCDTCYEDICSYMRYYFEDNDLPSLSEVNNQAEQIIHSLARAP